MYRIGIDLGGTNIAAGIINDKFEIIAKTSVPTGAQRPAEEIVADMVAVCYTVCREAGIKPEEIASVSIAAAFPPSFNFLSVTPCAPASPPRRFSWRTTRTLLLGARPLPALPREPAVLL